MAELLLNPALSVAGVTLIRGCHLEVSPAIPAPPGSAARIVLDPSPDGISQFNLALTGGVEPADLILSYTLDGNSNGSVFAVMMGASSPRNSGDGAYADAISPTGTSSIVQFRTAANTDGAISGFSLDPA